MCIGSYAIQRAALFHLYPLYGKEQSRSFVTYMKQLMRGFKRRIAKDTQNGTGRIQTGKVPLPFGLYRKICMWMLEEKTLESRFAHAFLTLTWNLCCRSANTVSIHVHHMEWAQDALRVYFCHQKNDQSGEKKRDPRHIY